MVRCLQRLRGQRINSLSSIPRFKSNVEIVFFFGFNWNSGNGSLKHIIKELSVSIGVVQGNFCLSFFSKLFYGSAKKRSHSSTQNFPLTAKSEIFFAFSMFEPLTESTAGCEKIERTQRFLPVESLNVVSGCLFLSLLMSKSNVT